MKQLLLAAGVLALGMGTAAAQDTTYDWSGAYVGVQAGHGWGDSLGGGFTKATGAADAIGNVDPDGFLGGLYAGYSRQFANNATLGVEGDISFTNFKGSVDPLHNPAGAPFPPNSATSKMDWNGSVRIRAGYAIDRFLPYITGGVAFGRYEFTPEYTATGPLPGSKTQTGWTIGAGLEHALTDHLTTRIEYRYTDFGRATYEIPSFPLYESRVDLKTQDIRFGIAYKF